MSEEKVLEREIREIIARILDVEPAEIKPEARFVEDLGMDSMMALEIVAAIEKRYKIAIPEEQLTKLTNLKEVLALTQQYLKKK